MAAFLALKGREGSAGEKSVVSPRRHGPPACGMPSARGRPHPACAGMSGATGYAIATISASPLPAVIISPTLLFISARATGDTLGERTLGRLGLILADDAPGLPPSVIAQDHDGRAEPDFAVALRRGDELRGRAARGPVASRPRPAITARSVAVRAPACASCRRASASSICARPSAVTRLGCSEIGRSGSSRASAPSDSLTKARLTYRRATAGSSAPFPSVNLQFMWRNPVSGRFDSGHNKRG